MLINCALRVEKSAMFQIPRFWADKDGATALEYGLLAVLIAAAIVGLL